MSKFLCFASSKPLPGSTTCRKTTGKCCGTHGDLSTSAKLRILGIFGFEVLCSCKVFEHLVDLTAARVYTIKEQHTCNHCALLCSLKTRPILSQTAG